VLTLQSEKGRRVGNLAQKETISKVLVRDFQNTSRKRGGKAFICALTAQGAEAKTGQTKTERLRSRGVKGEGFFKKGKEGKNLTPKTKNSARQRKGK